MASSWFVSKDGNLYGPFSSEELHQLAEKEWLQPDDLIRKGGSQKWVLAQSFRSLFPELSPLENASTHPGILSNNSYASHSQENNADDSAQDFNREATHNLWKKLLLYVILCGLIAGLVAFLVFVTWELIQWISTIPKMYITITCAAIFIIMIIYIAIGISNSCPKCKKWFASQYKGSKVADVKRCYGLVTRYSKSYTSGWISRGDARASVSLSGVTEWKERVPVIQTTYEHSYVCRYCGAHWTTHSVEEEEDFERG
jgi:hypothetical protein